MTSSVTPTRFIGCDVGKRSITVFDSQTQRSFAVANTAGALRAFAKRLDPCCLVICEATGGYEGRLLASLVAAEVPAHRADARKVKAFIRSFGTLGKSDKIDAKGLSRYGAERHARLGRWQPRDEDRLSLQTLVLTRQDLVKSRTAFQNRLVAPQSQAARPYLRAVLAKLAAEIAKIEARIEELERDSAPDRRSGRTGATPQPERRAGAISAHARRTTCRQGCPVHGRPFGLSLPSHPEPALPATGPARQKADRSPCRSQA